MDHMHIDRTPATTTGTGASMDLKGGFSDNFIRDLSSNCHNIASLVTLVIAKAVIAVFYAAEQDRCPTIITFSHLPSLFCQNIGTIQPLAYKNLLFSHR